MRNVTDPDNYYKLLSNKPHTINPFITNYKQKSISIMAYTWRGQPITPNTLGKKERK